MPTSTLARLLPSTAAQGLMRGRFAMAAVHLFAPQTIARVFRADMAGTTEIYARMFAVRDAALAIGLARLAKMSNPRGFLLLNAAVDTTDALAFALARRRGDVAAHVTTFGITIASVAAALGLNAAHQRSTPSPGGGQPMTRRTRVER